MSVNELKSVDKLDLTDLSYEHDKYVLYLQNRSSNTKLRFWGIQQHFL